MMSCEGVYRSVEMSQQSSKIVALSEMGIQLTISKSSLSKMPRAPHYPRASEDLLIRNSYEPASANIRRDE